ncbi:MAG TPA: arsenate reductase family protein [Candidatus Didemnitutus sp.]|nr:arsenate reductase family protein [Candidatus Didemnitutus sp.]
MPFSSLVFYAYSNCSTCRDAAKWLRAHNIAFSEKPVYETPPGIPELKRMLAFQDGNLRRLFNTSGMVYRELGLAEKLPKMSEAQSLTLLASNGRLVKRPFLIGEKAGLVGFDPDEWAKALV